MRLSKLETDQLLIRAYTPDDLDVRHRLMVEAFADTTSNAEILTSTAPLDNTRQWLDWTVANYRELDKLYQPPYGDYAVVLKATGEVIGSVGLVPALIPWAVFNGEALPDHPLLSPEFGLFWAILPVHWGQGYAPEAARALVDFTFTRLHARRIVATTEFDNVNSQRVMAKLGMTIKKNPGSEPPWCQVVGVLDHPRRRT